MKVLITDGVDELMIQQFKKKQCQVHYHPEFLQADVEACIADFDILIINSKISVDSSFLQKAKQLKAIGRLGSGLEIIDLAAAKRHQVAVFNSPEGNRDAVAEHAIGMLLNLLHKLNEGHQQVASYNWYREEVRGQELGSQVVGIIGMGNTGMALAQKLKGFGVECFGHDIVKKPNNKYIRQVDMTEIKQKSTIISLHLPYTKSTHHYVDDAFINKMKNPFYLINTSRGKVVKLSALNRGLESGKVIGAGIDVFENEKMETLTSKQKNEMENLLLHKRLICTPHVAGWTIESKKKLAQILVDKIAAYLSI